MLTDTAMYLKKYISKCKNVHYLRLIIAVELSSLLVKMHVGN